MCVCVCVCVRERERERDREREREGEGERETRGGEWRAEEGFPEEGPGWSERHQRITQGGLNW